VITEDPGFATQIAHSRHPLCVFFHYTTFIPFGEVMSITLAAWSTDQEAKKQAMGGILGLI